MTARANKTCSYYHPPAPTEARSLKEVSTCRVALESPGTTRSKTALSRLSEMFSPLPSRKNSGVRNYIIYCYLTYYSHEYSGNIVFI